MGWLERNWMWLAAGGAAAALVLTSSSNAIAVTLAPTSLVPQAVTVPKGGTITISLPAGAQWVSVAQGTATIALSGSAPFSVSNAATSAVLVFQWRDSSGAVQLSTLAVTVA